ncbi:dephospho-CoA kinase [Enterococcus sp. UD-01]|jgi:dephospho-CoA kinase|uniref:dephospho-CoA kinase n=1 Tax=Enterococcus sp. UD-01 TaxID=3373911 RepID=UPI0038328944
MSMVLGLTGGIATGKSTVSQVFKEAGFPIIDGDLIAREIVEPGQPALKEIAAAFGSQMIDAKGSLNRKKLGKIIFNDSTKRVQLNKIMSPYLRKAILAELEQKKQQAPLVVLDIPLLYEGGYEQFVDQVAVVYVPEKIQLQRLIQRDQLTAKEAQQRINSQWPIEQKKQLAEIVFDNQGTKEETKNVVKEWLTLNHFNHA